MASDKQIEANRANAKNSTGPKTQRGKDSSRGNALKHGLTASHLIIPGEDADEFEVMRKDLAEEFQATTRLEYELINRLAGLLWRLRRIPTLETTLVKARQSDDRIIKENEQEAEYWEEVEQEAAGRFEESYEHDSHAILVAKVNGTYAEVMKEIREEVEAEWRMTGDSIAKRLKRVVVPSGHESLLMLLSDLENADSLGKLTRYEVSLMNAVTRTMQLLHLIQARRDTTKRITVQDTEGSG